LKALVIGSSGQVGTALSLALKERGHTVFQTYHKNKIPDGIPYDLTKDNPRDLLFKAQPQVVFCPGGATNVDRCEETAESTHVLNVQGPFALAATAVRFKSRFVYFSSEYVFDGKSGPYREEDESRPLSVYGRTKAEAEFLLLRQIPGSLILRTAVVYGPEPQEKNTVYQLLRNLSEKKDFRAPQDQITTPTFNRDLAESAIILAERGTSGLVHVAGSESLSRYDFALEVCRVFGLDEGRLIACTTSDLGPKATRPLKAGLNCDKLKRLLERNLSSPREGLEKMNALISRGPSKSQSAS